VKLSESGRESVENPSPRSRSPARELLLEQDSSEPQLRFVVAMSSALPCHQRHRVGPAIASFVIDVTRRSWRARILSGHSRPCTLEGGTERRGERLKAIGILAPHAEDTVVVAVVRASLPVPPELCRETPRERGRPLSRFRSWSRPTRSRLSSVRSTSRHRSACSSERRTPVSTKVRKATRSRSSVNARASACTSSGRSALSLPLLHGRPRAGRLCRLPGRGIPAGTPLLFRRRPVRLGGTIRPNLNQVFGIR
jgi:hypothetical protein